MSTGFDLQCSTCGPLHSTGLDLNWGGEALAVALEHRPALEAFGKAAVLVGTSQKGFVLNNNEGPLVHVALFLAQHVGHTVIVVDEYGRILGTCAKDITCACGARHHCRLDPGHQGECAR